MIRLLGARTDVPDLIVAADVVVVPSRVEGLPGAVLEAMALERPVVAVGHPDGPRGDRRRRLRAWSPWTTSPGSRRRSTERSDDPERTRRRCSLPGADSRSGSHPMRSSPASSGIYERGAGRHRRRRSSAT